MSVPIELPATVHAAAVQDSDGGYTIYVNTLCPENVRQEAVYDLIQQIVGGERHG